MRRAFPLARRDTPDALHVRLRPFDFEGAIAVVLAAIEHDGDITATRLYDLMLWQRDQARFVRVAGRLRIEAWRRRGRKAPPLRAPPGGLE